MRFRVTPRLAAPKHRLSAYKQWIDPYPGIPGTKPEKIVYAEMMNRGIPFQFQEYIHFNLPLLDTSEWFRADFSVPVAKVILNVHGTYWHTQPAQVDKDALTQAFAELSGWRVVTWWDFEIEADVVKLFDADPYLRNWPKLPPVPHRAAWHDDSAGIRTINASRAGRIKKNEPGVKTIANKRKRRTARPRYRIGR